LSNIKRDFEYIHKKNFLSMSAVENLVDRYDAIKSDKTYKSIHENVIQLTDTDVQSEFIFEKLRKDLELFFDTNIGIKKLKLEKLWLVSSTSKNVRTNELPYISHFDKRRYMKAMVYLHSVTKDHGPIHIGKARDKADIEMRRIKLPDDYKMLGLNLIENTEMIGAMEPMIGNPGDVIFFDTNSPHKAGAISEGYERRVLRFDFEADGLNKKIPFVQRMFKKIIK
jgi:hypothetical protein